MLQKLTLEKIEEMQIIKMLSPTITDNRITMFAANAGNGKTTTILSELILVNKEYPNKKILYFDYDQGIHRTKLPLLSKVIHFADVYSITDKIAHLDAKLIINSIPYPEHTVIVIDGFQSYVDKEKVKDISSTKDMNPLMDKIKALRTKGFTVILIHHNTKKELQTGKSQFRGSPVIQDSLDNLIYVQGVIKDNTLLAHLTLEKFSGQGYIPNDTITVRIQEDGSSDINTEVFKVAYPNKIDEVKLKKIIFDNQNIPKIAMNKLIQQELQVGLHKANKALNTALETNYCTIIVGEHNKHLVVVK